MLLRATRLLPAFGSRFRLHERRHRGYDGKFASRTTVTACRHPSPAITVYAATRKRSTDTVTRWGHGCRSTDVTQRKLAPWRCCAVVLGTEKEPSEEQMLSRFAQMRPIATDDTRSVVCVY